MRKKSSTNYVNQQELEGFCDAAFTLSLISGRWKLTILTKLSDGEKQFSTLKELIPAITERILSLQLKGLLEAGLIEKIIESDRGRKVILYKLGVIGKSLSPVIESLSTWGKNNKSKREFD